MHSYQLMRTKAWFLHAGWQTTIMFFVRMQHFYELILFIALIGSVWTTWICLSLWFLSGPLPFSSSLLLLFLGQFHWEWSGDKKIKHKIYFLAFEKSSWLSLGPTTNLFLTKVLLSLLNGNLLFPFPFYEGLWIVIPPCLWIWAEWDWRQSSEYYPHRFAQI